VGPLEDSNLYTPVTRMGPTASAVTVVLLGLVGSVTLVLVPLVRLWQAARRARAFRIAEEKAKDRALAPGLAVLQGTIETDDGRPAVRVTIRQRGTRYTKKRRWDESVDELRRRWSKVDHKDMFYWSEIERTVESGPFFLRLASGERVQVDPDGDVLLVADLSETKVEEPPDTTSLRQTSPFDRIPDPLGARCRLRIAELVPKETAHVVGQLSPSYTNAAYRGGEHGFCIRPASGQRMLISGEPLEARYERRARFHRNWFFATIAGFVSMNGLLFASYWMLVFWGKPLSAMAVNTSTWTTRSKNETVNHYAVDANAAIDGRNVRLTSETSERHYDQVHLALQYGNARVTVPFLAVPSEPWTAELGTRPTLSIAPFLLSWLAYPVLPLCYLLYARHARPWYEREKVNEQGEPKWSEV
jgi:hypothetical protein